MKSDRQTDIQDDRIKHSCGMLDKYVGLIPHSNAKCVRRVSDSDPPKYKYLFT